MLDEVRAALANLKTNFPAYDGRGYELAGFVWYQGWNDGCQPKTAVPEYEQNLVNLIRDVRKDLAAPHLPVVVGELTGPWVEAPGEWATLRKGERYKTGVWMAGFAEATIAIFLGLEKGEEQWGEDRARSGGVTGVRCWRDSDGANCR